MTTPLDRDLAERLERLAAAVPVRQGQLDPVHRAAVTTRHQVRMRWLTPLVVLLITALAFLIVSSSGGRKHSRGDQDLSPLGESSPLESSPPVSVVRDGDFALTLRASKHVYAPGEPIGVTASLLYFGNQASVEIHTDSSGPIMYGIKEKVFGAIDVGTMSLLICKQSTLTRNVPLIEPFKKSGGFSGDDPNAAKYRAWIADPDLRLPEGTWHLYAVAQAPCMGGDVMFNLQAEIEILVTGDPGATPGLPVATDVQDKPVYGGDDIGNMTFQVVSKHPTYEEGTPIDLDAYYSFGEGNPDARRPFVQQVEYRITQSDPNAVDQPRDRTPMVGCADITLPPREERHLRLDPREVALLKAVAWPDASEQALQRGMLVLPPGHWRITVTVRAIFGPCGLPADTWEVHASVEVDVLDRS